MSSRSSLLHLIGATCDFWRFVHKPVTCPKRPRRSVKAHTSSLFGFMKTVASSAYMDVQKRTALPRNLLIAPSLVALSRWRWRGLIARIKRRGDRGSPFRSPFLLDCLPRHSIQDDLWGGWKKTCYPSLSWDHCESSCSTCLLTNKDISVTP